MTLNVGRVCPKPEKPGKKPEPENLGPGQVGFHYIRLQVSQVSHLKTQKIRVGSGFGFFRVFGHSTYVDDLLAAATTHQEMLKLLDLIFAECRYHGMKLNLKKCILGVLELTWLGYALNEFGISPEYDKAEAIKSMKPIRFHKSIIR